MNTINSIKSEQPETTMGVFRTQNLMWKRGRGGQKYLSLELEDATGVLTAYSLISDQQCKDALVQNKRMLCRIRLHYRSTGIIAEILSATAWVSGATNPLTLIPQRRCPIPDALLKLSEFREKLSNHHLQHFVDRVLQQDDIAFSFISAPASLNHHHNEPGGLLVHSLECAEIVGRLGSEHQAILELGQVAALFHDIGKIKTLTHQMKRTQLGFVVDHNALALEILAPALSQLERRWPDGATTLRYLLTWHHHPKPGTPLMVMAEVVRSADRISSGQSIQDKAFSEAMPWQNGAKLMDLPNPQRFWRPRQLPQQEVRS